MRLFEAEIPKDIEHALRKLVDKRDKLSIDEFQSNIGKILSKDDTLADKLLNAIANR